MHILRKSGIYHYNRRIPDLLKSYIGSDCVRFSLKVKNHQQAMILGRKIDSEVDILIFRVKTETIDPDKIQEKLIQIGLIRPSETRIKRTDISWLFSKYTDERLNSGRWTPKTALENKRSFTLFIEWAGNLSLEQIDHKLLLEYREVLRKLPPNLNTSPLTRDKTLTQILLMDHKRVLSVAQVNKYLVTLTAFFSWLQEHEFISHNPAHHLLLPKAKREKASEERLAYTVTEIKLIKSTLLANRQHLENSRPERFWVPLIAAYTGMRLTEAAQLYCKDISKIDDVWCFNVNETADDQRLKNASSIRIVPVHPELISLGLFNFWENSYSDRLFPKLTKEKFHGYGRQISKWFTTFNRRFITQDPKKTFHSIRHSVANELKQLQITGEIISELLGHKIDSITMSRYGKRYRPKVLLEAIEKLPW